MNIKIGSTIYLDFITYNPGTGVVSDADATPTVEVFENDTDTPIITPTPVKRTGKTGDYRVQIDTTSGNGFEIGKWYNVVFSATVGGSAIKGIVARFQVTESSQDDIYDSVTDIAATGSAINQIAESATITTGVESGTYQNTFANDGTYHQVQESAGTIDFDYQFDITQSGIPTTAVIHGRLHEGSSPGGGDSVSIYLYNWNSSSWELMTPLSGDFVGVANSTPTDDEVKRVPLFSRHVGSGANAGKVKIRLYGASLETGTIMYIDQIYVEYTVLPATASDLSYGIKRGQALNNFYFVMVSSTDHVTPLAGLTVTGQISKDGGSFQALTNNVADKGSGGYSIDMTATEMDAKIIVLRFTAPGADERIITIITSD